MERDWHETELRVRYSETDAMRVVYHANYLNWFEVGRTEMMRAAGIPYRQLEERGILLPVVEARVFFQAAARYDDLVAIRTRLSHKRVRIQFDYQILRKKDGQLLAEGYTVHAWVNRNMKPVQLRKAAPEIHEAIQRIVRAD